MWLAPVAPSRVVGVSIASRITGLDRVKTGLSRAVS